MASCKREFDGVLCAAASGDFARYHPQRVIEAVNALLPLGKNRALEVIDCYLAGQDLTVDPNEGLFLVLRVLFEVPLDPGYQPRMRLGGTSLQAPLALRSLPHFPLVLIDDWPLMLVSGFTLGGDAEPVTEHLRYFRSDGTLRAKRLSPSHSERGVLDEFKMIYHRAYGTPPTNQMLALIEAQLASGL
jgi:hypothetical protein